MNLKGSTSTRPGQPCASGFFDVPCCHLLEVSPSYRSQTTICFTFGRDASIQREQLGLTGNLHKLRDQVRDRVNPKGVASRDSRDGKEFLHSYPVLAKLN